MFLLTVSVLFCLTGNLFAGSKPTAKYHGAVNTELNKEKRITARRSQRIRSIMHPFLTNFGRVWIARAVSFSVGSANLYSRYGDNPPKPGRRWSRLAPSYSSSTTTLGSGFNIPAGVAVDSKGNIFIGDQNNNAVKEILFVGSNAPIIIATELFNP